MITEPEWFSKKRFHVFAVLVFAMVVFSLYAPSLHYDYVWDDQALVVENTVIHSARNIPHLFFHTLGEYGDFKSSAYRPVQILSFLLDYRLFKNTSAGYHFSNILYHLCAGIAVYLMLSITVRKKAACFLSTLLFLIHPAGVEAVSYISGRADSLGLLWMCLSFSCYVLASDKTRPIKLIFFSAASFFYLLGIYSKESALILPLLIALYERLIHKKKLLDAAFLECPIVCRNAAFVRTNNSARCSAIEKTGLPHCVGSPVARFQLCIKRESTMK